MSEPRDSYSPERRTALLLSGSGVDGAYHAGALRALQEAGVKIDIVGGRGVGALGAVLAAVDGGTQLWERGGFWRTEAARERLYEWRWPLKVLQWITIALSVVLAIPAVVIALGLIVYPVALLLGMSGLDAGTRFVEGFVGLLSRLFSPGVLPTWIPRIAALLAAGGLVLLATGAWLAWWRAPLRRKSSGSRLWELLGAPMDGAGAITLATDALWRLLKGGAALKEPEAGDLSRRYAELLNENLGQPGFRELLLVVHDLDARRDLVFGLVREPYRRALFPPPGGISSRRAEAHDLASGSQALTADVLAAALSLPGVTEPQLLRFAADAYWRGETHRLTDRPGCLGRLIEEAAAAGAEQVVLIAATPEPPGPHELRPPRRDGFGRIGELLASTETTALGDAVRHLHHRVHGFYVIRPAHNPLLPLDLIGAYDERSDRIQSVDELMERGYEDAYRQFIEPVLGASGDRMVAKTDAI